MRLALDEDETKIADEANRILADAVPIARLHRVESTTDSNGNAVLGANTLHMLAEPGWFGLLLAETAGGAGMSEIEFALFFREVGRQCAPIDLLSQSLAVLLATDNAHLRDSLLSGQQSASLLVKNADGTRLLGTPGDFAIEVTPHYARLYEVRQLQATRLSSLDPAVPLHQLPEADLPVVLQTNDTKLWRHGQLAVAAMLVGIAEAALDQIVAYAKIRETFGKPIGSYQAVRHPCADIAVRLEAARCQLWFAAAALKDSRADALSHLDAAKHLANESAAFATDQNIQLHGGIGVTDEHDAHIFMKHALLLRKLFGAKRLLLNDLLHATFGA